MQKFPHDFFLGATTAAHQVEGQNLHSDSWAQEHMKHTSFSEPSGYAVDHYHLYDEDIRLLADAGLNTYRFSIEWARIEPEEGHFDDSQIEHYRHVIHSCKENGVRPFVCMHHFSSPKWLIGKGGWEAECVVAYFRRYCAYVIEKLGDELEYVCTINEANMRLQFAHITQKHAQALKNAAAANTGGNLQLGVNFDKMLADLQAIQEESAAVFGLPDKEQAYPFHSACTPEGDAFIIRAHVAARSAMKALCPHLKIGITLSLHDFQVLPGGEAEAARRWEEEFSHYLPALKEDDFIGVQNYTRELIGPDGALPVPAGADLTDMGYEYYPEGLAHVLRKVAKEYSGDLYVTENGVAAEDDTRRIAFIARALDGVQQCIAEGIPVKGYLHWSLLDNFEWQKGFSVKFGLIGVDRATQTRLPKPSLAFLGSFAEEPRRK